MKEPNIGTPDEDEIRKHFKGLLDPAIKVEIVPHTKVWATDTGVLLWDPKNGYANALKPDAPVTQLKCLMYVTGPQASGKTVLCDLLKNSIELRRGEYINYIDLKRYIDKASRSFETVVVCDQRSDSSFEKLVRSYADTHKLIYFNINLTRNHNGN